MAQVDAFGLDVGDEADVDDAGYYGPAIAAGLLLSEGNTPMVNGLPQLPVETSKLLTPVGSQGVFVPPQTGGGVLDIDYDGVARTGHVVIPQSASAANVAALRKLDGSPGSAAPYGQSGTPPKDQAPGVSSMRALDGIQPNSAMPYVFDRNSNGELLVNGGGLGPIPLAKTTNGYVLTLVSGFPQWQPAGGVGAIPADGAPDVSTMRKLDGTANSALAYTFSNAGGEIIIGGSVGPRTLSLGNTGDVLSVGPGGVYGVAWAPPYVVPHRVVGTSGTTSYTLTAADAGQILEFIATGGCFCLVPGAGTGAGQVNWKDGTQIEISQNDIGKITLGAAGGAGGTAVLVSLGSLFSTSGKWSSIVLRFRGGSPGSWVVTGSLS